MHGQNRNTTVDNIHAIVAKDVSDGSTATLIDLTKFCSLEADLGIIEDPSDTCHEFSRSIVRTRLTTRTGVLVDYKTDYVGAGGEKELVDKYKAQLDYYARALEQLTGKKVTERIIYSFALSREIMV